MTMELTVGGSALFHVFVFATQASVMRHFLSNFLRVNLVTVLARTFGHLVVFVYHLGNLRPSFSPPKSSLFKHFLERRIKSPVTSLSRIGLVARNFYKALVQWQIMPDAVLPSSSALLVIREVRHYKLVNSAQCHLFLGWILDGHRDQRYIRVWWFGEHLGWVAINRAERRSIGRWITASLAGRIVVTTRTKHIRGLLSKSLPWQTEGSIRVET